MTAWKSSVLRCFDDDDHCPVCRFLRDDLSVGTLLKVIEVLDTTLGEAETEVRTLTLTLASKP